MSAGRPALETVHVILIRAKPHVTHLSVPQTRSVFLYCDARYRLQVCEQQPQQDTTVGALLLLPREKRAV